MSIKQKKLFYMIIFLVGLATMIWEITIYRRTFIDIKILLGIIVTIGILTTYFSLNDFQKLFNYKSKSSLIIWTFMQCACSWGFLACFIFMFTNYYGASEESHKQTFEIIDRYSMTGRKHRRSDRIPTFKILYNGKIKELVFSHNYYEKMESFQNVELTVKKGLWGYDVIVDQKLK